MFKNSSFELTKRAMDIMNILWDAGKPLTASDFLAYDSTLTLHTVHAYLKNLLKNNLIEVDKIVMSGNDDVRELQELNELEQLIKERKQNLKDKSE